MKLAFYRGHGSPVERIILNRTNAVFCHVELRFSDGTTFSSDLTSGGTRFTDGKQVSAPAWTQVALDDVNETALRAWCEARLGEKYGTIGCVCFLLDVPDVCPSKPFCSQVCVEALQAQGVFKFLNPSTVSPQELYIAAMARTEKQ